MDLLTKEETLRYIRDVLETPVTELPPLSDPSLPGNTKVAFIESILKAHLERQPFQSISLMALNITKRHRPTWEEIKSNMFSSQGGLCYWHNTFMYVLLASLGLDVTMSHSSVGGSDLNNHLVVLVHDLLIKGDLHLVDVGVGFYIPHLLPLDFEDESPVYTDSILTYKFNRESENKMALLKTRDKDDQSHSSDAPSENSSTILANSENPQESPVADIISRSEEHQWERFYQFDPTERSKNLEAFFPCFGVCFTDITKLSFHTSPRAVRFYNDRMIALVNAKLLEEKISGQITKTVILKDVPAQKKPTARESPGTEGESTQKSGEATDHAIAQDLDGYQGLQPLIDAYGKYFPQFPLDDVLLALNNWRLHEMNKQHTRHNN